MKNLLLLLSLSLVSIVSVNGQYIGGKHINETGAEYIEIVGYQKMLKMYEVGITVHYGQVGKLKEAKLATVTDENGNTLSFNGMIGVVNYFAKYGYKLEMAYPITYNGTNVYHYIMHNPNRKYGNIKSED
jgi:hypothetical protein